MSTITRTRINVFDAIKSLFASGIDVESQEDIKLSKELDDALVNLSSKEKEVEQAINTNNSTKKGGFGKKVNPIKDKKIEADMRMKYNAVKKDIEDKERG